MPAASAANSCTGPVIPSTTRSASWPMRRSCSVTTPGRPRFVYANSAAASLWRMSIEDMIGMPSRLSAPADARDDRARMLSDASRDGVLSGYSGERVASDGTRFQIVDATLWTVDGYPSGPGQAVVFSRWEPIDDV